MPRSAPASPPTVALEKHQSKPDPLTLGTATAAPLSPAPPGAELDRLDGNIDSSKVSEPEDDVPGSSEDTEAAADETDHLAAKPEESDDVEANLVEAVTTKTENNKVHKTTVGLIQSVKQNDSAKEVPCSDTGKDGKQRN